METPAPAYPVPARPTPAAKPQPSGWGKLGAAFGLGVAAWVVLIAFQLGGEVAQQAGIGVDANLVLTVSEGAGAIAALLFVVALGGKAIAKPQLKGMGEAWRAALWLFAADGLFVALEIGGIAAGIEHIDVAADWPIRMAGLALLCLAIGLFEETTMRGLCLNGLLARFGRTRGGVYAAVIVSSLLFGFLHFDPFIDFGDPLQVAQNLMKVLQAGMCGFLFAGILVKTRNLWALASIHAANDFMLLFLSTGLVEADLTTQYVAEGDQGIAILLVYIILCGLYTPFLVVGSRMIDQVAPWRGDFYHYEQPIATPTATPTATPAAIPVATPVARMPQAVPVATPMAAAVTAASDVEDAELAAATARALRGKHARLPQEPNPNERTPYDQEL